MQEEFWSLKKLHILQVVEQWPQFWGVIQPEPDVKPSEKYGMHLFVLLPCSLNWQCLQVACQIVKIYIYFTFRIAKKRKSFLSHSYFWLSRSKEWGSESPIISMYSLIWIKSHHFWINKTVQMSESVVKIDKKSPFTTNGSASYPPCN